MIHYRTPGIYFEWLDQKQKAIHPLRTDIAGLVGITARGPLHQPTKLGSWTQFVSIFGGHIPQGYLAYAVEGFFANGGQTCWVVRVADPRYAESAHLELLDDDKDPALRLTASTPGVWARDLVVRALPGAAGRFSLSLRLPDGMQEFWSNLTFRKHIPNQLTATGEPVPDPRFVEKVLNDPETGSHLVKAECLYALPDLTHPPLRSKSYLLEGGHDGLDTLISDHFSGETAVADQTWGLKTLETVDRANIMAIPDIMPKPVAKVYFQAPVTDCADLEERPLAPTRRADALREFPSQFNDDEILHLQNVLIQHCEKLKDRFAVLDPLLGHRTTEQISSWRRAFQSNYAALYYPWLRVPDPLRLDGNLRSVPPSGHVAGVYARCDQLVGVHKPPANEIVEGARDVTVQTDDPEHGDLNTESVNVIRSFNGRGIRIVGARTLERDNLEWRYVNVRRLLLMIEEAIDEQTQWIPFEPNNTALWRDIDRVIRSFLDGLWRRGFLDGATAKEAYLVRCDAETNTFRDMELGRTICIVGVQPPLPAEFVVVRIGRTENGTEFIEPGGPNG